MSDAAPISVTPTSMPVANGATPESGFHAGGSYHEFKARLAKPAAAPAGNVSRETPAVQVHATAPAPKNTSVVPQPTAPAAAAADPNAPPPDPNAPPAEGDPNAPPAGDQAAPIERQLSPEDHEKWLKLKSHLDNGTLPEEFEQVMVPLKNGDQVEYETLKEVREGRMRHKDHMRGVQQRDAERIQEQEHRRSYEQHFESIRNPETGHEAMYDIYTRNGMRPQLMKLAEKFAQEEQQDIDTANGIAYAVMMRLGITDGRDYRVQEARQKALTKAQNDRIEGDKSRSEKFEIERLRKQNQARQQEGKTKQEMDVQRNQLNQLRPRAFEATGLDHEHAAHRDAFDHWLGIFIRTEHHKAVSPELVMRAARAAKEDLADLDARRAAAGQPPLPKKAPPPRPFNPTLGGGNGRAPGNAPPGSVPGDNGQAGWTPDAFAEKFKMRRW